MIATSPQRRSSGLPILEVLGLVMIMGAIGLLVVQLSNFSAERQHMPYGLMMGDVPVGGLPYTEAQAYVEQVYGSPVLVTYGDQEVHLIPDQIGLQINSEAMLARADELRTEEGTFWSGFWDYLWLRPERTYSVELVVDYSEDQLRAWLVDVAARYDRPPQAAQPVLTSLTFAPGQPGYTLDQEASLEVLDAALRRPVDRTAELVVKEVKAPLPSLETLKSLLTQYLASQEFKGVASVYVIDEQSGEEMEMNLDLRSGSPIFLDCDIAYASTSTMKIPILVEYFRYLDWLPIPSEYDLVEKTMVYSANWSANSMMNTIGFGDTFKGTEIVTNSMQNLGLQNTFIVAPYDEEEDPEYYSTPAREAARAGTCVNTRPDPYMQTTIADLAIILDMIYQCAEFGGGGLIAAYPEEITPTECQMMLDVMKRNEDGRLIMAGVPEDVPVAHKHGWTADTQGDAGIVFSPGGDYVLTFFLWADTDWLNMQISFPLMQGISEITFNYFNPDMVDVPRRGLISDTGTGITP